MLHTFIGGTSDAFEEAITILLALLPTTYGYTTGNFQCYLSCLYTATAVQVQQLHCSNFAQSSHLGYSSLA